MKKVFVFGAISLILLIVVLSGCQKNVAGEATAIAKGIRANSCDADNMCETNNLNTNRIIAGKVVIADSSVAGSSETNVITTTPDLTNLVLTSGTNFDPSRKPIISVRGILFVSGLEPASLTEGNAYVCVNNLGQLFRSATPCK